MIKGKILIVEDEPLVADDIERTVEKLGYQIVGKAISGKEALTIAEERKPDLALMDISIKGEMDGITTGSILKERFGTALIYLTAHSDIATFERAKITEPYGYVIKPFQEADLRIALGLAIYKRSQEISRGPDSFLVVSEEESPNIDEESTTAKDISHTEETYSFLKKLDLFSLLPEADLRSIARQSSTQNHSHGSFIVCEGDKESTCFLVLEGRVSMMKSSENGNQLVVELLFPGDLFSIVAAFEEEVATLTARAQKGTRVIRFPKKFLFALLSKHPEFYKIFVRESTRRLRTAHNMMRAIAHDKVENRIASALAELAKRPSACPSPEDGINITRQEIADLTGTSVETAIRITRSFEEQGILGLSKRGAVRILKPVDLKELIGG